MDKPVVIRFQIRNLLEDYAKIGNFLRKYETHTVYTEDELVHVSRAQVNRARWADDFLTADYKDINVAQTAKLHKYLQDYQIYFYIEVDGTKVDPFTLTNFQYLFLLFAQFSALNISCAIIDTRGTMSLYHRLSHYFALLNTDPSYCPDGIQGGRFYDHVWFYDGKRPKRLQKKRIGGLQAFLPLIPICVNSSDKLFTPMGQVLSEQDFKDIETVGWQTQKQNMFNLLDGCKTLLSKLYDRFPCLAEHDFSGQVLAKLNLLIFFIFCYSAVDMSLEQAAGPARETPPLEMEERLRGYARRLAAYGIGLRQIVENIVHYAQGGTGVLSLRRYEPEKFNAFLEGRGIRQFPAQDCTYLVFEIVDYSPLEETGNLSDTFKRGLPEDMRKLFQSITPADFFMAEPDGADGRREQKHELEEAWHNYRSFGENLTKHFGLYIFQQIIRDSNGLFFMESHATHTESPGERYSSLRDVDDPDSRPVLPGTAYTVCFPLTVLEPVQDSGIDKRNFNYNSLAYLEHQAKELPIPLAGQYGSPAEKSRLISTAARKLQAALTAEMQDSREKVFQFNMSEAHEAVFGELWCKSLLVALFSLPAKPRFFAFYNCSQQFMDHFKEGMGAFFRGTEGCNPLSGNSVQISLFQKNEIDALIFFPESLEETLLANEQLCRSRGIPNQLAWPGQPGAQARAVEIAPLEVICKPTGDGLTLFELYTREKLGNSIQGQELGCKIEHTHMRLGSAVHICTFYEAELLFSNSLFYSRFAFLLLKELQPKLQQLPPAVERLVLYGYSSYSELLLVELQMQLRHWAELNGRVLRVEYLILEREAEQRGFNHTDRIRSSSGISVEELSQLPGTKYILVVPINSTLKTHNKMCFLLERTGIRLCGDEKDPDCNLIGNFGLITVGPPGSESKYWKRDLESRTITPKVKTLPVSTYFIFLPVLYHEADTCKYCFPQNPLAETPLIEVNAASTIPNQSFSLDERLEADPPCLSWHDIKAEQDKLECLRPVLAYGHITRGENHFLYYLELEKLLIQEREAVKKKLQAFREAHRGEWDDYNIIFCPLHFSNAGFVELINNEVFSGSALVIRVDVDKEFRTNARAKFSYLKTLVGNLSHTGRDTTIRVHYVDDNILSGRTFHRSKSLMTSLLQIPETGGPHKVSVRIFDTLFLLLNRNLGSSLESYYTYYPDKSRTKYFCFLDLRISSLRTHGDSCVLCNLHREADRMRKMSSTKLLYDKWGDKRRRFRLRSLEEHKTDTEGNQAGQHGFFRMAATHTAGIALSGAALYDKCTAFQHMASLMLEDLKGRSGDEEERREFFFSYLKVISRPFLIFHKTVKEAALDLLLVLMEYCLGRGMDEIKVSLTGLEDKQYLCEEPIYGTLSSLSEHIGQIVKGCEADYLKILMSQLTELKSNYALRMEKMDAILDKINSLTGGDEDKNREFYAFYLMQVKRLTSISSDTSKSLWLTREIYRVYGADKDRTIPQMVELVILENTRVLFDAVSKLTDGLTSNRDSNPDVEKQVGEFLETLYNARLDGLESALPALRGTEFPDAEYCEHLAERYDVELNCGNGNRWKNLTNEERIKPFVEKAEKQRIRNAGRQPPADTVLFPSLLEGASRDDTYLYENLKGLMDILGYMDAGQPTWEGTQLLLALTALRLHLRLCFPETELNKPLKMPVLEIYSRLTALLRYLLDADKLCIVTEIPAKYNIWKATIAKDFNQLAEENKCDVRLSDCADDKNYTEYLTLADGQLNDGGDKVSYQVEDGIIKALCAYKELPPGKKKLGYLLRETGQKTQFVLALGGLEGKGIYLYASFYQPDRIRLLHRISCGLLFFPELVGMVFDEKENRLLQELVQERYDLSIQQRAKAHSHTRDQELVIYYRSAFAKSAPDRHADQPGTPQGRSDSDVLCLVSDLIISDIYRSSLSEDFYLPGRGTGPEPLTLRKALKGIWSKDESYMTLWMREPLDPSHDSERYAYVELRLHLPPDSSAIEKVFGSSDGLYSVSSEDRIRYLSGSIGSVRVPLFLLALSRNAVKDGMRQEQAVDVYFVKTAAHDLRIANKVSQAQVDNPETVRKKYLDKPPANVTDGISLWSVSRYIQAIVADYLDSRLGELRDISYEGGDFNRKAEQFVRLYQRLTSQEFALQVRHSPVCGSHRASDEVFFCVDLPLLEEKYNSIEREETGS